MAESRVIITADSEQARSEFERLRAEATGALQNLVQTGTSVTGMLDAIKAAAAAAAGYLTFDALVGGVGESIDRLAALDDAAQKTGSSIVESLSKLQKVAIMTGTDFGMVDKAVFNLAKTLGSAGEESTKARAALAQLGISAKDIEKQDTAATVIQISKSLQNYKDDAGKSAVMNEIFKKSAEDLAPYLNDVAEGVDNFKGRSAEAAAGGSKFQDNLGLIKVRAGEVFDTLAEGLLPALNTFTGDIVTGSGALSTFTGYIDDLSKSGKIKEWGENAAKAIGVLSTMIIPATKIAAAYYGLFVAAPTIIGLAGTALAGFYGVVGTGVVRLLTATGAGGVFNTVLFGTSVNANLAAGALTKMKLAGSVLFAAFAGWEIGKYITEKDIDVFGLFTIKANEARMLGLAFVGSLLKGWENLTYNLSIMFEAIGFAWDKTLGLMRTKFAKHMSSIAEGFSFVGAGDTSRSIEAYAESLRSAGTAQQTFEQRTAGMTAAHEKAISTIDNNIVEMFQYEMALGKTAKAEAAATEKEKEKLKGKKDNSAAIKKEADAYIGLMTAIAQKISETAHEAAGLKPLNDAQKLKVALDEQELTGKQKLLPAHKALYEARIKTLATNLDIIESNKRAAAGLVDITRIEKEYQDSVKQGLATATGETEKNEELVATFGMTKAAIEALELARLQDQLAQRASTGLTLDEIAALEALIAVKKRNVAAVGQLDALEAEKKVNEERLADSKKMWESVDQTAHDTFVNVFESGKNAFDKLRDTLKAGLLDLLYQMTIKKWILNVGTSVSNTGVAGIAGAAQAVTGGTATGAIGAAQSAGSLYNAVSGTGMAGMLSTAGSGIAALGTTFGSSAVSAFGAGFAAETGAGIMTAAETFGAAGMAAEASAASLGAAFSAAIPWIGAAVAAVGVWNAFFEDGPEKNTRLNFTSNNAAGAISINERGNEGKTDAYIGDTGKSSFGTFGVSSTFWMEAAQPVVESFIKTVSQTDDALAAFLTSAEKASVTSYLTGKTSIAHTGAEGTNPNEKGQLDDVFTDRINNILAGVEPGLESLVKDFDGTSQALATEAAALLQYRAALKDSGEALFGQVVTMQQIAALKAPTETSAEALKRVGVEFTATNQVATIFGKTSVEAFGSAGLASETARRQLVLFAGGADALASSTVAYSQNFMSDAERLAPVTKALGAAMDSLGLAGVTTKDQFKAAVQGLVNSGALATEEGAKQYAGLMAIQSTFTQVADAQAAQVAARRAIEIQIMEAQGNTIGATAARREDELAALKKVSPELVDLQKNLYAVQDAATAAAEAGTILGIQASMYEAMGDKAGAAAVLELQHTAALIDMTPAVADASIKLWDAQKAEKARNTELATTNSILGYQQQIAEATGDKLGAATASQELFNLTLKDMTPEVAGWATKARNAQLAQKTSNDALEDSNQLLGFESTMYTAKKDKVNLAITAEKQFQNSLVGLSPVLVKAATDAHTAVLAEKALSDARVENNGILSLQERYYAATGDAAGALKVKLAQQKDALIGLSPEMANWTQKTWDAEDANKIAVRNRGLEIEIAELTGNKIGALTMKREDEAKGVDKSTKALLDQRNAAQDVEAAAKVNEAREKIEVQMLELQGKKTEALTVSRRSEFWQLDSTLVPMMQRLHVLQDEATAATQAAAILDLLGQRYEAQGNAAGLASVKLQQQNAALKEMTPALAAATKATWDAQAAQKVAETRRGIEIQIMEAQGKTAEALAATRADEIKALEMTAPALVGLKLSLYGIQDAAALTEKQHALDIQLMEATGKSAAALAVKRFDELAALTGVARATQLLIYAAEDAATALTAAKTATDAALAAVQKAVEVEKTRITVIRDAAAESVTSIKGVFDLLKTQVEQLYGAVGSTAAMQAAQGQQFIDEALQAAQTGGKLPDQQALADAIAAARGGLDATQYATQFEADRAALVMAGKLAQLKDTSGYQLTAAEQALAVANDQLTALDAQLTLAQQQVDTLNGINASVTGLPESLAALAAAIAAQKAATAPAPQTYASAPTALTSMPVQAGGLYATTRMGEADLVRLSGGVSFLANDTWSAAQTASYVSGLMSTYSANAQALASLTAYGKDEKLPGFAVGINYVPQDMTARIHEGEAIVPASFNPFNPNARSFGSGDNEELIAEIRELRAEVGRLRGDVGTGNNSLRRIDSATNGNPDQPVPVAILEDETA